MEVSFSSRKMQKICNSQKEMRAKHGVRMAKALQQRLVELKAADTLDDVSRLRPARCHEMTQHRKGQLAVDLVQPYRLVFKPDHDPVPTRPASGLDWTKVTRILIIEIVDYH